MADTTEKTVSTAGVGKDPEGPAPTADKPAETDPEAPAQAQTVSPSEAQTDAGPAEGASVPASEKSPPAEASPQPAPTQAQTQSEKPAASATAGSAPSGGSTPLEQFAAQLPDILAAAGHTEMWGVTLQSSAPAHVPTAIVLQKFLNANDGDLAQAVEQFRGALEFRKEKKPLELLGRTFSASKFANLGAVTVYPGAGGAVPEVFTWNMYGNVKGRMDEVFVPLEEFLEYRIALQELGIQQLNLAAATEPITADRDPYKITQVHDYKNISFLRQNPNVKAASTEVIKQFSLAYPELLKEKFFVNVPAIMGWMYALIKLFVAEKTAKKFHPMANGANLAAEFKAGAGGLDGKLLPKEYGGEGGAGDGKMKSVPGLVDELKFA